jgi:hypothetical protein
MSDPKHYFALYELRDFNNEFVYLAFTGDYSSNEEFISKVNKYLECNPESDNCKISTKYGKISSITTRKIKPQNPNAHVHFCTGRYGLVGFGRHVMFDQTSALRKYESDSRPHTLRNVKLLYV